MKNSSGAIGAAKAPPYLVSHRRIINVIRIMYPRNSDRQGSPAGLRSKKGGKDGELRRERRVFMLWDISQRYQSARGKGGGDGKGREAVRVQRERRRCPHDHSPRQGRIFSLLNPGVAISAVRCQAHVFCICHFLLRKETAALECTCQPRFSARHKREERYELEKFENYT